ncbi:hypothetical protein MAR_013074 [Mya arenaria]|uniref:Uncharacterized protein n=1 Tax=Mya arenaria TaxID=6604 RepID=A0ABY7FYT7_MYAAR|nr:hypothetical protein MAR_013074 [Mya arenaria]
MGCKCRRSKKDENDDKYIQRQYNGPARRKINMDIKVNSRNYDRDYGGRSFIAHNAGCAVNKPEHNTENVEALRESHEEHHEDSVMATERTWKDISVALDTVLKVTNISTSTPSTISQTLPYLLPGPTSQTLPYLLPAPPPRPYRNCSPPPRLPDPTVSATRPYSQTLPYLPSFSKPYRIFSPPTSQTLPAHTLVMRDLN